MQKQNLLYEFNGLFLAYGEGAIDQSGLQRETMEKLRELLEKGYFVLYTDERDEKGKPLSVMGLPEIDSLYKVLKHILSIKDEKEININYDRCFHRSLPDCLAGFTTPELESFAKLGASFQISTK